MKMIAPNVWVVEQAQRFMGLEIGARMSIVKLTDGSLFLHSPIALTADLLDEIRGLGQVKYAVAPNCFHHLYIGEVIKAFPNVKIYVAPKLKNKRPDLDYAETLESGGDYPWSREISHLIAEGMPMLNEVVFLHRESKTLFVTDLAFNIGKENAPSARIFAHATGIYGRLAMSKFDKFLFIKDQKAAAKTFQKLFQWDFEKVVMAHGRVVLQNGKEALRRGLPSGLLSN